MLAAHLHTYYAHGIIHVTLVVILVVHSLPRLQEHENHCPMYNLLQFLIDHSCISRNLIPNFFVACLGEASK